MSGYTVDTDAMRQHASKLEQVKSTVDVAIDAGKTTMLDVKAFGVLCAFLAPPAIAIQGAGLAGIGALSLGLQAQSTGITAVADGYDTAEEAVRGALAAVEQLARDVQSMVDAIEGN